MLAERFSRTFHWQLGIAIAAIVPAFFLGVYFGSYALRIGSPNEFSSVLLRAMLCAAPPTVLAFLSPRFWQIPSLVYGIYFYHFYLYSHSIHSHPEIIWMLIIAGWCTTFTAWKSRNRTFEG